MLHVLWQSGPASFLYFTPLTQSTVSSGMKTVLDGEEQAQEKLS